MSPFGSPRIYNSCGYREKCYARSRREDYGKSAGNNLMAPTVPSDWALV
jgi:hypothetical protein